MRKFPPNARLMMSIGGLFAERLSFKDASGSGVAAQGYGEPKYLMAVWIGSCWASTLLLCLLFVKLKRILKACCPSHVACCMLYVACFISYAFLPQTETETQGMLTSREHRGSLHRTPLWCGPLRREPIALPCLSIRLPPLCRLAFAVPRASSM